MATKTIGNRAASSRSRYKGGKKVGTSYGKLRNAPGGAAGGRASARKGAKGSSSNE